MLGGLQGVGHEHGDGHGADAAGGGGDGGGDFLDFVAEYVAAEAVALLAGVVVDAVHADVDDDGAGFDVFFGNHFGASDGGDEDVGLAADGGHVLGAAVDDGDGGVAPVGLAREQEGEGSADDVGASGDNDAFALGHDVVAFEQFDDAFGGAGDEGIESERQAADADGVKTVDVLVGVDAFDNRHFVESLGQGRLDEDAVDLVVGVEAVDGCFDFCLCGGGGHFDDLGVPSEFFAGAFFGTDIDFRGGVFADEQDDKSGLDTGRFDQLLAL